jgi:high-affinity iron transporter
MIAVRIMTALSDNVSALHLQAATGLLAVVVLLVIMNWFFHKIYWGGWIRSHNRRWKALLAGGANPSQSKLIWGLILLGFTSLYREGFEVVLFLQTYHLRLGGAVVLKGALLGLGLSGIVAILTFVLQQRLPYRNMLVTTGILLGGVLLVMVGEQAQEMQLANWLSTTPVPGLVSLLPDWAGLWFAVFPTYETLVAQLIAAILVIGSYFAARRFRCTAEPASRGCADLAATHDLENASRSTPESGEIKLTRGVFAERSGIDQSVIAAPRRKQVRCDVREIARRHPVVAERPDLARKSSCLPAEVIGENIKPAQIAHLPPAINEAANHRLPSGVRIIKNRVDRSGRRWLAGEARVLDKSFTHPPSVVFAAAGIGSFLDVDLFAFPLPDVAEIHVAGFTVETIAPGIAQSPQPDLLLFGR